MATARPEREYLIDRLMDDYVDWREECNAVRQAYEHWLTVRDDDQALAFAAYRAALDREESAARVYAGHFSSTLHFLRDVSPLNDRAPRFAT